MTMAYMILILSPLGRHCKKRPCTHMDVTLLLGGDFSWQKKVQYLIHTQMR